MQGDVRKFSSCFLGIFANHPPQIDRCDSSLLTNAKLVSLLGPFCYSRGLTRTHLDSLGLTWARLDSLGLIWTHLESTTSLEQTTSAVGGGGSRSCREKAKHVHSDGALEKTNVCVRTRGRKVPYKCPLDKSLSPKLCFTYIIRRFRPAIVSTIFSTHAAQGPQTAWTKDNVLRCQPGQAKLSGRNQCVGGYCWLGHLG